MLKRVKLAALHAAESAGVFRAALNSRWRQERLLILCYHGTAMTDEHQWDPSLYISPSLLRRRLQVVVETGCTVLPLREAVTRLYAGTLPPRSVAITYDDGTFDFYAAAWPVIREFGFPVTVYLTTYYAEYNRPVFDVMLSYLLWKAGSLDGFNLPEVSLNPGLLAQGRASVHGAICAWTKRQSLSGAEKDALLARVASSLGIDYHELCRNRVLHIMRDDEVRELTAQGVTFELHTHRHRLWRNRDKFFRELDDNRQRIAALTSIDPVHFCYPGGVCLPEFPGYLEEYGAASATTCVPGLCSNASNRMRLPRLVDTSGLTDLEFRSWVAGVAEILPQRPYTPESGQLGDEPGS